MAINNLLYKSSVMVKNENAVDKDIDIIIPTVGEILKQQNEYYSLLSVLTAVPIDLMVQLDNIGVDFTTINEYELFLRMFAGSVFKDYDTSLFFGNLKFSELQLALNNENGTLVLIDDNEDIIIDQKIHSRIAQVLRKIHHLEKNRKKPANEEAKQFMLERAKKKLARKTNREEDSQLESLIIAMVNTEQFKYDFESVKDISIYQFNESVRQIIKKVDYDNRMYGVYSGTINAKELSQEDLNWLVHK